MNRSDLPRCSRCTKLSVKTMEQSGKLVELCLEHYKEFKTEMKKKEVKGVVL